MPRFRILLALLLLLGLAGAGQAAFPAASTLDAVRARGVLRIGTAGDYKPFAFRRPDGRYAGADIVMARRLAKALRVRLEIVPTTWGRLLPDFIAHRYDIAVGGVSVLPERARYGTFSKSLYADGKRPICRCADKARFTSMAAIDRPEVRVIVNPGGSNESFARSRLNRARIMFHRDNVTIFDEIVAGRADVMVTDGVEVVYQTHLRHQLCAAEVKAPFTRADIAYLLPRDPALVAFVDRWLGREIASGAWPRILEAAMRER